MTKKKREETHALRKRVSSLTLHTILERTILLSYDKIFSHFWQVVFEF